MSDNLTTTTTVSTIPNATVVATHDLSGNGGTGHAQKIWSLSGSYVCTGSDVNISATTSAVIKSGSGLTIPANTTHLLVSVETQSCRFREDGVAPTSTNGVLLSAGDLIELPVPGTAANLQFIGASGTAILNISYRSYR